MFRFEVGLFLVLMLIGISLTGQVAPPAPEYHIYAG